MAVISVINKSTPPLPYTCEQAFDLAADIERYPEFLRGWVSARIQRRESNIWYVEQVVGLGPFRWQFISKAVLHRPERIEVTSTESPFRLFSLSWLIAAMPSAGCRVSVVASLELQSRIMQRIVNQLLPAAVDDIISAFEARAHRVYGAAGAARQG
jgi:coenzyme Q-binding protein COQ10